MRRPCFYVLAVASVLALACQSGSSPVSPTGPPDARADTATSASADAPIAPGPDGGSLVGSDAAMARDGASDVSVADAPALACQSGRDCPREGETCQLPCSGGARSLRTVCSCAKLSDGSLFWTCHRETCGSGCPDPAQPTATCDLRNDALDILCCAEKRRCGCSGIGLNARWVCVNAAQSCQM
jgi:hypothetical protein